MGTWRFCGAEELAWGSAVLRVAGSRRGTPILLMLEHALPPLTALACFLVCAMFIIICQIKLAFGYWDLITCLPNLFLLLKFDPGDFYVPVYSFGWKTRSTACVVAGVQSWGFGRLQNGCGWGLGAQWGVWWHHSSQVLGTKLVRSIQIISFLLDPREEEKNVTLGELAQTVMFQPNPFHMGQSSSFLEERLKIEFLSESNPDLCAFMAVKKVEKMIFFPASPNSLKKKKKKDPGTLGCQKSRICLSKKIVSVSYPQLQASAATVSDGDSCNRFGSPKVCPWGTRHSPWLIRQILKCQGMPGGTPSSPQDSAEKQTGLWQACSRHPLALKGSLRLTFRPKIF